MTLAALALLGLALGTCLAVAIRLRRRYRGRAILWQWGRVERVRHGLTGSDVFDDEPATVAYVDFRYWLRLRPNPGWNLPGLGYYSRARGRRPLVRFTENAPAALVVVEPAPPAPASDDPYAHLHREGE